jgi:AraC-like DNA-binding protein
MNAKQSSESQFIRVPYLPSVELRFSHYSQDAFHRHIHEAFAVGVITQGRTRFSLYMPEVHEILAGPQSVVLINPGQVHACNPQPGSDFTYYMLYLGEPFLHEVGSGLPVPPEQPFRFQTPLVKDPTLYADLLQVCRLIFNRADRLEVESGLYSAAARIMLEYGAAGAPPDEPAPSEAALQKSRDYLQSNPVVDISLRELAGLSGLSPYYFVRAFRSQYGLPPHEFQLQQRIQLARQFLAQGKPIAEVAADTGFADQSHFTRKFKALVGATPGQYQRGLLAS